LLEFGADVNVQDLLGYTPLHYAGLKGKRKQVAELLLGKADITIRGRDERTALHCAAIGGVQGIVRLILEQRGARVDVCDRYQRTPLHWAAFMGNYSVVEILLSDKSSSQEATDDYQRTSLHYACLCEEPWLRTETVKVLLKSSGDAKAAKDRDGKTAVALAVDKRHTDVMRLLAENDHDAQVALRSAAENGDRDNFGVLLEKDVDIDARDENGRNALHCAAAAGHDDIIIMLLEYVQKRRGASETTAYVNSTDANQWTALHHVANGSGDYEAAVQLLVDHGADVLAKDARGQTPLLTAALAGHHPRIVKLLIHDGIDAVTALHRTIENDDLATATALVDLGVELEAEDTRYNASPLRPLSCAARFGRGDIVRLLLERGAIVNGRRAQERVSLHWACERGHLDIVRTLLDAGADPELPDERGDRPLHWAAAGGHAEIVDLLLAAGTQKDALDAAGMTPLEVCKHMGTEMQTPEGKEAVEKLLLDRTVSEQ
jgi:ankyrin repeat protein